MLSTKPLAVLAAFVFVQAGAMPATAAGNSVARLDAAACDKPHFPARWQEDGDGASVVVGYLVGADGKVVDSKIVRSSGFSHIDRASERAGARCTFVPADGAQGDAWTTVKYSWVVN
jgi:TonB family protein